MLTSNLGRIIALGLGAAALLSWTHARADIVPWEFTGHVTSIENPGGLVTPIAMGQQVNGTFTFADATEDFFPTPDGGIAYLFFGPVFTHPPYGLVATIGDATFDSDEEFGPSLNIITYDGTAPAGGDLLRLVESGVVTSFPTHPQGFSFFRMALEDTNGLALASDALPLVPPLLTSLTLAEGTFGVVDEESSEFLYTATFQIDSLVLVPSPAAGLTIGFVFLLRRRR